MVSAEYQVVGQLSRPSLLLNDKSVRQAQLPLLCTVVPMGYMFRPYMRVIIRPLHK